MFKKWKELTQEEKIEKNHKTIKIIILYIIVQVAIAELNLFGII